MYPALQSLHLSLRNSQRRRILPGSLSNHVPDHSGTFSARSRMGGDSDTEVCASIRGVQELRRSFLPELLCHDWHGVSWEGMSWRWNQGEKKGTLLLLNGRVVWHFLMGVMENIACFSVSYLIGGRGICFSWGCCCYSGRNELSWRIQLFNPHIYKTRITSFCFFLATKCCQNILELFLKFTRLLNSRMITNTQWNLISLYPNPDFPKLCFNDCI